MNLSNNVMYMEELSVKSIKRRLTSQDFTKDYPACILEIPKYRIVETIDDIYVNMYYSHDNVNSLYIEFMEFLFGPGYIIEIMRETVGNLQFRITINLQYKKGDVCHNV